MPVNKIDGARMDAEMIKQIMALIAKKLPGEDLSDIEELLNSPNGSSATPAAIAGLRELQEAQRDTAEVLGAHDAMALDSAAAVYRKALARMGVDTIGIASVALKPIFVATRRSRRTRGIPMIAMDAKAVSGFAERYPHGAKIEVV